MIPPNKLQRGWTVLTLAGLLASPCGLAAEVKKTVDVPKSPDAQKAVLHHTAQGETSRQVAGPKSTTHSVKGSAKRRRRSRRHTLAQIHLEPQRVKEIQGALAQAGYLHAEPTDKWDGSAREAMRRYQADHGFPTTGLPESKTLMKLGLGPHPLPEDVDPQAASRASPERTPKPAPRR